MTTERPNISPTGRYSTVQAAKALGVDRSTIRKWSNDPTKKLTRYVRKTNLRVFFKGSDLIRIWENYM